MSPKSKKSNALILALFFATLSAGCNNPDRTAFEYMPDMSDSLAVKAQREPMRVPPEGTVPVNFTPYPYAIDQGELAGTALTNNLDFSRANLLEGKKMYDSYCIVCHGPTGKGDGSIVPKFPMPPSLHSDKVAGYSDGRLFHIITKGQNLMPSYASQINPKERWSIILYVRALQRAIKPTPEDIAAYNKVSGK